MVHRLLHWLLRLLRLLHLQHLLLHLQHLLLHLLHLLHHFGLRLARLLHLIVLLLLVLVQTFVLGDHWLTNDRLSHLRLLRLPLHRVFRLLRLAIAL